MVMLFGSSITMSDVVTLRLKLPLPGLTDLTYQTRSIQDVLESLAMTSSFQSGFVPVSVHRRDCRDTAGYLTRIRERPLNASLPGGRSRPTRRDLGSAARGG